jgi:hypothetical protein
MAPSDDTMTVAQFLTRACQVAAVDHAVDDVPPTDDPAFDEEFAGMARLARRRFPVPLYDNTRTIAELGHEPTRVDAGLELTIRWLRDVGAA